MSFQLVLSNIKFHKNDIVSGFLVFLIAMPLSLGIAAASGFPPIYGLFTAMVGGLIVSFFVGSELTIKGPAAGLIVIIAAAVHDFGKGDNLLGWKLTLATIFTAGILQMILGKLKMGKFVDIFPVSAVRGMLTAIGIIIISKQVFVLIGETPIDTHGELVTKPLNLLFLFPTYFSQIEHWLFAAVGVISIFIMAVWQYLKWSFTKSVPPALVVLVIGCIIGVYFGKPQIEKVYLGDYFLVVNQSFTDFFQFPVDFNAVLTPELFIRYTFIFTIVGSLESLLTVKAIDKVVNKGKSDYNKDLIAVGIGNTICGLFGGLPMIAEVARSTANVGNGAVTRWSNFFHGIFILLFLLLIGFLNESIPLSALAAMLILVGWKLSSPSIFKAVWDKGKDQFVIFISTVIVSLFTDILTGIGVGILFNISFHFVRGLKLKNVFKLNYVFQNNTLEIYDFLVFTNYLKLEELLSDETLKIEIVDLSKCLFVDQSSKENLQLKIKAQQEGVLNQAKIVGWKNY
jgi:MFS superfamily sulfate permease-like transporter